MPRGGDIALTDLRAVVDSAGVDLPELARRLGWTRTQTRRRRLAGGGLGAPYTVSWADTTRLRIMLGIRHTTSQRTSYEQAAAICAALDIDPADHGFTPRPVDRRECLACYRTLPITEFHRAPNGHRGRDSHCRGCCARAKGRIPRLGRNAAHHDGTDDERFDHWVDTQANHWMWLASSSGGHGQFRLANGRVRGAHRYAWERWRAPIPPRHRLLNFCGERLCVRPDHYELRAPAPPGARGADRRPALYALAPDELVAVGDYVRILRRDPCSYCDGDGGAVDHIEAVSAGGSVDWPNLTAACGSCNARKHTQPMLAWMARRTL